MQSEPQPDLFDEDSPRWLPATRRLVYTGLGAFFCYCFFVSIQTQNYVGDAVDYDFRAATQATRMKDQPTTRPGEVCPFVQFGSEKMCFAD